MISSIKKFNENILGVEVEYLEVENEKENVIIFGYEEVIHIMKYKDTAQLIEELIKCKIENDVLKELLEEQEEELEENENMEEI